MTDNRETNTTKPVQTIRCGNVRATIWKKEGKYGAYYNVTIARVFSKEDGTFGDSNSFSPLELLAASRVANQAMDQIQQLELAV